MKLDDNHLAQVLTAQSVRLFLWCVLVNCFAVNQKGLRLFIPLGFASSFGFYPKEAKDGFVGYAPPGNDAP